MSTYLGSISYLKVEYNFSTIKGKLSSNKTCMFKIDSKNRDSPDNLEEF